MFSKCTRKDGYSLCTDCKKCFERSFASSENIDYFSEDNVDIDPRTLFKNSINEYIFDCYNCKFKFVKSLRLANNNKIPCNHCNGTSPCREKECAMCFKRSFAGHEKARYWSTKNDKKGIFPWKLNRTDTTLCIFNCIKCNHEFEITPQSITQDKSWCHYCGSRLLCKNDCDRCFKKSLASITRARLMWDEEKNIDSPRDYFKNSGYKKNFICDNCSHKFTCRIADVQKLVSCKYCSKNPNSGSRVCGDQNCPICIKKSFAEHPMHIYWSNENGIEAGQCSLNSNKKYIFNCPHCKNKYRSSLLNISNGVWCPCTKNKSEYVLYKHLIENIDDDIIHQQGFKWIKRCKFDFYSEKYNFLIELDGRQHFETVDGWESYKIIQERDEFKNKQALEHGISIIKLYQKDISKNLNNWKNKLNEIIKIIKIPPLPLKK